MSPRNKFYPHLLQKDIELWERYLELNPDRHDYYEYDVRVGEGRDPGEKHPKAIRSMAIDLSTRRIDAVGHSSSHLEIIEITCSAGFRAIGQVLAYPLLYAETFRPNLPIKSLLVAESIQTDIRPVLDKLGILYVEIPNIKNA